MVRLIWSPLPPPVFSARSLSFALELTLAELACLDVRIRREVVRLRLDRPAHDDAEFRGLYVSDEDVDRLSSGPPAGPVRDVANDALIALDRALDHAASALRDLETRAGDAGHLPRLSRLCRAFRLSAFERSVVVLALAAEVDLKYERLYAYLQDDVTKKRPTVDLALKLFCPTVAARAEARAAFGSHSPLMRGELVTLVDDPGTRNPVLLARCLKLDERIVGYLLGSDAVDFRLAPLIVPSSGAGGSPPGPPALEPQWSAAWQASNAAIAAPGSGALRPPVALCYGRYGSGRQAAAAALAATINLPLLALDSAPLPNAGPDLSHVLRIAEREAILTGAVLCWRNCDHLLRPEPGSPRDKAFIRHLARGAPPTVIIADQPWEPAGALERRPFFAFALPDITYAERRQVWAAGLNGSASILGDQELSALAARYRLTHGQIEDALARARTIARARDPLDDHLTLDDLDAACRTQAQHQLSTLARKLTPRYSWADIVLPAEELNSLQLICTMIRQRGVVYGEWGFDRKLAMGKGVMALFAGPSGTGKTMAAEIIARELGLDVYKIDLSAVVNKYIGETEKNLERLFSEAQDSDAILFFDEADALFGKRSGVSDAHDRYANIETAYLLQRTEEYNGLVILATNLPKNVDEAFARRLHFSVTFPLPEEDERLEIWRRTFPPEAPRSDDVDLPFLARKLKIAGGNIRNIVLAAAFLAAEESTPIGMPHLVRAAGFELQKMGKMLHESDFERYFSFVRR